MAGPRTTCPVVGSKREPCQGQTSWARCDHISERIRHSGTRLVELGGQQRLRSVPRSPVRELSDSGSTERRRNLRAVRHGASFPDVNIPAQLGRRAKSDCRHTGRSSVGPSVVRPTMDPCAPGSVNRRRLRSRTHQCGRGTGGCARRSGVRPRRPYETGRAGADTAQLSRSIPPLTLGSRFGSTLSDGRARSVANLATIWATSCENASDAWSS